MGEQETYSEEELNRRLTEQRMFIRLDSLDNSMADMVSKLAAHAREEEFAQEQVLARVTEGMSERRKAEQDLHKKIDDQDKAHHDLFVKKTDLRMYALLIIFAVSATVSVITWLGMVKTSETQDDSMHKLLQKIEQLMDKPR